MSVYSGNRKGEKKKKGSAPTISFRTFFAPEKKKSTTQAPRQRKQTRQKVTISCDPGGGTKKGKVLSQ